MRVVHSAVSEHVRFSTVAPGFSAVSNPTAATVPFSSRLDLWPWRYGKTPRNPPRPPRASRPYRIVSVRRRRRRRGQSLKERIGDSVDPGGAPLLPPFIPPARVAQAVTPMLLLRGPAMQAPLAAAPRHGVGEQAAGHHRPLDLGNHLQVVRRPGGVPFGLDAGGLTLTNQQ